MYFSNLSWKKDPLISRRRILWIMVKSSLTVFFLLACAQRKSSLSLREFCSSSWKLRDENYTGILWIHFFCSAKFHIIATVQLRDYPTFLDGLVWEIEQPLKASLLNGNMSFNYLPTFFYNSKINLDFTGFFFLWYFNWYGDFQQPEEL